MIDAAVVLAVLHRDPVHDPLRRNRVDVFPVRMEHTSLLRKMTSLSEGAVEGSHPSDRLVLITRACLLYTSPSPRD